MQTVAQQVEARTTFGNMLVHALINSKPPHAVVEAIALHTVARVYMGATLALPDYSGCN